jgi:hypothetical protein
VVGELATWFVTDIDELQPAADAGIVLTRVVRVANPIAMASRLIEIPLFAYVSNTTPMQTAFNSHATPRRFHGSVAAFLKRISAPVVAVGT